MFLETKCIAGSPGCHGNHCNLATKMLQYLSHMEVFQVHIWHSCSLWQYILMDNFVVMETLLP